MAQAPLEDTQPAAGSSRLAAVGTLAGLCAGFALAWLALAQRLPAPPAATGSTGLALPGPQALAPCVMDPEGYWRGRVVAGRSIELDWRGATLECAGEARPGDRGLRLFFAGRPGEGADRLLIIVGIAARLEALDGREHPASVTLVDEASSRFFRSRAGSCFTRVHAVTPLGDEAYRIEGELYCIDAIAAVGGAGAVTVGDSAYAGRLGPAGDER